MYNILFMPDRWMSFSNSSIGGGNRWGRRSPGTKISSAMTPPQIYAPANVQLSAGVSVSAGAFVPSPEFQLTRNLVSSDLTVANVLSLPNTVLSVSGSDLAHPVALNPVATFDPISFGTAFSIPPTLAAATGSSGQLTLVNPSQNTLLDGNISIVSSGGMVTGFPPILTSGTATIDSGILSYGGTLSLSAPQLPSLHNLDSGSTIFSGNLLSAATPIVPEPTVSLLLLALPVLRRRRR